MIFKQSFLNEIPGIDEFPPSLDSVFQWLITLAVKFSGLVFLLFNSPLF